MNSNKENIQEEFDSLVSLLELEPDHPFVDEILSLCKIGELTYHAFPAPSAGTTKAHILAVYERRGSMENDRKEDPFVFGYDQLLPSLRSTRHESICIIGIDSDQGHFSIFTDFEKTEIIGILKTKRTLTEIRQKQVDHLSAGGVDYYKSRETIFINGKLCSY
jgi:hypothetical protein